MNSTFRRVMPTIRPPVGQGLQQMRQQAQRGRLAAAVQNRRKLIRAERARQAAPAIDHNLQLDQALEARSDRVARQIDRLQAEIKADDVENS